MISQLRGGARPDQGLSNSKAFPQGIITPKFKKNVSEWKLKVSKRNKKDLSMDTCNTSIKHNLTDPRKILQDISPDFLMFKAYVQI